MFQKSAQKPAQKVAPIPARKGPRVYRTASLLLPRLPGRPLLRAAAAAAADGGGGGGGGGRGGARVEAVLVLLLLLEQARSVE